MATEIDLEKVVAAIKGTWLEGHVELLDGEVYFRYDTDDNTVKENESTYFEICEELLPRGYQIKDPYIEHDCITGNIVPKEGS